MELETILGRAMGLLPASWGDDVKLAVVAGVAAVCLIALFALMIAAFGKKRAPVAAATKVADQTDMAAAETAPDLNPEEWVSGDVIHYDRHKAFGYIRCDRVKGHVRFQAQAFKRAPRIGEKVRFKGRHGALRKPVAIVVEPVLKVSRAG